MEVTLDALKKHSPQPPTVPTPPEEEKARIIREEEEQKQKDTLEAEEAQLEADEADDIVETTSPVSEPQDTEDGEVLDTDELPEPEPQLNGDSGKKAKEALRIVTSSMPPPSELPRRRPDPLDLASAKRDVSARVIENLSEVEYPEAIKSPQVELNANSKDGRFRFAGLLL